MVLLFLPGCLYILPDLASNERVLAGLSCHGRCAAGRFQLSAAGWSVHAVHTSLPQSSFLTVVNSLQRDTIPPHGGVKAYASWFLQLLLGPWAGVCLPDSCSCLAAPIVFMIPFSLFLISQSFHGVDVPSAPFLILRVSPPVLVDTDTILVMNCNCTLTYFIAEVNLPLTHWPRPWRLLATVSNKVRDCE